MTRAFRLCAIGYIALLMGLWWTGPGLSGPLQFGTHLIYDATWQFTAALGFTLVAALLSTAMAFTLGLPLGIAAALWVRDTRWVAMVPGDLLSCLPRYILILLLFSIFGKSVLVLIVGCALAFTPVVTETTRTLINTHLANGRVEAFQAHGIGMGSVVFLHLLGTLGRKALLGEFISGMLLFIIVEASFAYIDPYVYSGLSTSVGMLVSRTIHGGYVLTLQSGLLFTGLFGFLAIGLKTRSAFHAK